MLFQILILPVLALLHLIQTAPLSSQNHHRAKNLTYNWQPHCTDSLDWFGASYLEEDCVDAIARLQHTDYIDHGQKTFEFLAPGASAVYGLPAFQTPKRYTARSCTVVIAMLATFTPGLIPDEPPRLPHGTSDVTSFASIWSAARAVGHLCSGTHGRLGWAMAGRVNHGIGVFVWATKSAMNRLVPIDGLAMLNQRTNASSLTSSLESI